MSLASNIGLFVSLIFFHSKRKLICFRRKDREDFSLMRFSLLDNLIYMFVKYCHKAESNYPLHLLTGLNLIIVLTFKKAMKSIRQAEELLREVSFRARTDCVYFIENYTWSNNGPNLRHPPVIKNDFEMHFTVLTIIRQCLEFIKLNRSQSKDKKNGQQAKPDEPKPKNPPAEAKQFRKFNDSSVRLFFNSSET